MLFMLNVINSQCHFCCVLFMLNVNYTKCHLCSLIIANKKPFVLNVMMLSVVILHVLVPLLQLVGAIVAPGESEIK
jgi:hypothetical protein